VRGGGREDEETPSPAYHGHAPGAGQRVEGGHAGPAFDEDVYVKTITEMFEHLRNRLGWNVKLLHDVHEHLNPNVAVEFAKRLEPCRLFFLEDVLPPEQIEWFRQIRRVTTTPMAMGISHRAPPMASARASCRRSSGSGAPRIFSAARSASRIGLKVRR